MLLFRQCKAIKTKSINSENSVKSVNSLSSEKRGATPSQMGLSCQKVCGVLCSCLVEKEHISLSNKVFPY